MDLSVIDTATLRSWHQEAIAALHALSIGRREVTMSFATQGSSRSGTFSAANRDELVQWIGQLGDELAARGALQQPTRRRRAIGVRF